MYNYIYIYTRWPPECSAGECFNNNNNPPNPPLPSLSAGWVWKALWVCLLLLLLFWGVAGGCGCFWGGGGGVGASRTLHHQTHTYTPQKEDGLYQRWILKTKRQATWTIPGLHEVWLPRQGGARGKGCSRRSDESPAWCGSCHCQSDRMPWCRCCTRPGGRSAWAALHQTLPPASLLGCTPCGGKEGVSVTCCHTKYDNNNNRGHFCGAVSHWQGWAHCALQDQQKCRHKTSQIIYKHNIIFLAHHIHPPSLPPNPPTHTNRATHTHTHTCTHTRTHERTHARTHAHTHTHTHPHAHTHTHNHNHHSPIYSCMPPSHISTSLPTDFRHFWKTYLKTVWFQSFF